MWQPPSPPDRAAIGRLAEERAAALLESHGATILLRNFRARCGELDLVALHAGAVLVVEVRRRQRHEWGGAAASVDHARWTSGGSEVPLWNRQPDDWSRRKALESVCRMVLNLNEVAYVD